MKRGNDDETYDIDLKRQKVTELYLAGYDIEDKRVIKAINFYETNLLPFINNSIALRSCNLSEIKGYGFMPPDKRAP